MKIVSTWCLEKEESVLMQLANVAASVKKNCFTHNEKSRIILTTQNVVCEYPPSPTHPMGLTTYVIIDYLDLIAIRTRWELDHYYLTLEDCDGGLAALNILYRTHLIGSQIYLQYFWCNYKAYNKQPFLLREKLRRLCVETIVTKDLFNAEILCDQEFMDLLTYWGVVLREDAVPCIDDNAPAYTAIRPESGLEAGNTQLSSEIQADKKATRRREDLFKITDIFVNSGWKVNLNQTIFIVENNLSLRPIIIYCKQSGCIQFKDYDRDALYSIDELESLFTITAEAGNRDTRKTHGQSRTERHYFSPAATKLLEEFRGMIGLMQAKAQVDKIIATAQINQQRRQFGMNTISASYHMIFSGNPGTGKTTVARILGKIFNEIGILQKGHFIEVNRSDLVGEYIGHSEQKTKEKIKEALGGVLFIDEAYSLTPPLGNSNDFGIQVISELVAAMENNRDNLIVIAAGYSAEMKTFISSNSGLSSRFAFTVDFQDYTNDELVRIFKRMVVDEDMTLDDGCELQINNLIELVGNNRYKGFGNAREIRNVFHKIVMEQNQRLINISSSESTRETLSKILPIDISRAQSLLFSSTDYEIASAEDELSGLIGLSNVKEQIEHITNMVKLNVALKRKGEPTVQSSLHMVFTGNPGTGKTTVARLLARRLWEIGRLTKNHLVEVSRPDLVAAYVGQTALKTERILESALGGVLFIDEAYALYENSTHNFGKESIEVILKFMEDNKDDIVVILAGYQEDMKQLINSNPGLKSRFSRFVDFKDYTADELVSVFGTFVVSRDFKTSLGFDRKLRESIAPKLSQTINGFGNGRAMRNLFEKVYERYASRWITRGGQPSCLDKEFIEADLFDEDIASVMT